MSGLENRLTRLLKSDSYLEPFSDQIRRRLENIEETEQRLTQRKMSLTEFASATDTSAYISKEENGYFANGRQTQQRSS